MPRQRSGRQAGIPELARIHFGRVQEMDPRAAMAAGGGEKKKRISLTMKKPKGGAV